jgi:hypothetical protein
MPANIKTTLLQRLRRTDMPLARRVRQLHADWFERMGSGGHLPPAIDEKRLSPVLLAQQTHMRAAHCAPFVTELPDELQSQWSEHQQHAQALLSNTPSDESIHVSALESTLKQFLSSTEQGDAPETAVQSLAAVVFRLGQVAAPQEMIQAFVARASAVLTDATQTLGHMEQAVMEILSPAVFQGRSHCLIQLDPHRASQCKASLFHHMLGLPQEQSFTVIGNRFTEGRVPVLLQHGLAVELPADVAEWEGPAERPDFLQLRGLPLNADTDRILNQPPHKGVRSPLQLLISRIDQLPSGPDSRLQLNVADLNDFANMQAMAGVGTFRARDRQIPNSLRLNKEESVYAWMDGRWQPTRLSELPDNQNAVRIKPALDTSCELLLPLSTVRQLQQEGQLLVGVMQQNATQLQVALHLPPQQTSVPWPDPALKNRQLLTQHYAEQLSSPGYLDKVYSREELSDAERLVGAPPGGLQDGVFRILKATMARTLIAFDTWTHQHQQGSPYYVSMTLMSPRQDSVYARRIGFFIHDAGTPMPTTAQLQQLGVDAESFMKLAIPTKEAETQLLRPLKNVTSAPFALTGHHLDSDLARIQQSMPALSQALEALPSVSRQPLVQTQHLTGRRDRVFTLTLERDNARPVHFFDAAGTPHSLMNIHQNPDGQWVSHDRSATLFRQGDHMVLLDHRTGLQGTVGTPLELVQQIQRDLRPAQGALYSSLAKDLCRHQQSRQWLMDASPLVPLRLSDSIPVDNLPMRRMDFGPAQQEAIEQVWKMAQPLYRFDWSIDDNMRRLSQALNARGLSLDTVIAGGTGGQRGRQYLKSLHQAQPELLSPLLQGKSFAWHPEMVMNNAARLDPVETELTIATWLHANMLRLLRNNPERALHAQMEHHIDAFLQQFEPTTQELPATALERWAKSTGIPTERWKSVYQRAYTARQGMGLYDSLIIQSDRGHPLGAHPVRELAAFTAALSQSALPQQGQAVLMMHSAGRWLDENLKALSLCNHPDQHVLRTVQLQEHRLQLLLRGAEPTPGLESAVEKALPLLHLSNAMHKTVTKSGTTDPFIQQHARDVLSSQLRAPENIQRIQSMQSAFHDAGITELQLRPSDPIFRQWCKQAVMYAMNLSGVSPDFNQEFSAEELGRAMSHLTAMLPEFQLRTQSSTPNAEQRLAHVIQQAKMQYAAMETLNDWCHSHQGFALRMQDQIIQKRQYAQQCEAWQIPVVEITLTDALRAIAQNQLLPLPCRHALRNYDEDGNLPAEPLARQIVQQTIKALRNPPPLVWGVEGPAGQLIQRFHVSATHPVEKMLDTPRYRELLAPSRPENTPQPDRTYSRPHGL